jgi:squalene synthase HpnC
MAHDDMIRGAFAHCEALVRSHHENFPVASLALPRKIRPYVAAVYAFARTADDIADEGAREPAERIRLLDAWEAKLDAACDGHAEHPVFVALMATIQQTQLPKIHLTDLLRAFRMDVTVKRYRAFPDVLDYCRYSANPVGRMILHLFGVSRPDALVPSDAICTGLQLANFWQDFAIDWGRGRLYVPLDDLARFGYTEMDAERKVCDDRFRGIMALQVDRARKFLMDGVPLLGMVSGRLRLELSMTIRGGLAILDRMVAIEYDVLTTRPLLTMADKARILSGTLFQSRL